MYASHGLKDKNIKVTTTGYNHSLSTPYYAFFLLKYTLEQPVSAMLLEGGGPDTPPTRTLTTEKLIFS